MMLGLFKRGQATTGLHEENLRDEKNQIAWRSERGLLRRLPIGCQSPRNSSMSFRKMVENLAWATGYNLAAIPLAAGVFSFAGPTSLRLSAPSS
jgi:hypothetical protein